MLRQGHCCKQVAFSALRESATCILQWRRGCVHSVRNVRLASWFNPVMHYFAMCLTLDGLTCRRSSTQEKLCAMSRISVRMYGRTIAGATNRLSVRKDGRMHGQLQRKASVKRSIIDVRSRRPFGFALYLKKTGQPVAQHRQTSFCYFTSLASKKSTYEPPRDKANKMACAPSEDSE